MTKHPMPDAAPNTADLFEIIRTTRLPIGYPVGRFGPVRRIALADVVDGGSLTAICSDPSAGQERLRGLSGR